MVRYIGIADAHGIESLISLKGNENHVFTLSMRAKLNRQRHAVFFVVDMTKPAYNTIMKVMRREKYSDALKLLKSGGTVGINIFFPQQINAEVSWSLIPNPRLDPWG